MSRMRLLSMWLNLRLLHPDLFRYLNPRYKDL